MTATVAQDKQKIVWGKIKENFNSITLPRTIGFITAGFIMPIALQDTFFKASENVNAGKVCIFLGLASFALSYVSIAFTAADKQHRHFKHNALVRLSLATAMSLTVGEYIFNDINGKQMADRELKSRPLIEATQKETPLTMQERHCQNKPAGTLVGVEDSGKKYRLICQ